MVVVSAANFHYSSLLGLLWLLGLGYLLQSPTKELHWHVQVKTCALLIALASLAYGKVAWKAFTPGLRVLAGKPLRHGALDGRTAWERLEISLQFWNISDAKRILHRARREFRLNP